MKFIISEQPFVYKEFLMYMQTRRGKSIGTIAEYALDLNIFFKFMSRHFKIDTSENGIDEMNGFLCCGDYDYGYEDSVNGIASLKDAISYYIEEENMVFAPRDQAFPVCGKACAFWGLCFEAGCDIIAVSPQGGYELQYKKVAKIIWKTKQKQHFLRF